MKIDTVSLRFRHFADVMFFARTKQNQNASRENESKSHNAAAN
jgi:hypothetical protein